jgi:hypothetical protein
MDMPIDTAPVPARKRRLWTAQHVDRRTRGSKRARKLAAELARGFGTGITEVQRRACEQAGMLAALAEDLAARRLAGQPISINELLRAEGVAKRAIKAVLAERPAPEPKTPRGLLRARERWAQAEEAKKAKQAEAREASAPNTTEPPDGSAAK